MPDPEKDTAAVEVEERRTTFDLTLCIRAFSSFGVGEYIREST